MLLMLLIFSPFFFAGIRDYLYFRKHHLWKSNIETPDHTQYFRSFQEYRLFGQKTDNYPFCWAVQKYRLLLLLLWAGFVLIF
jgi:hypothetical protein